MAYYDKGTTGVHRHMKKELLKSLKTTCRTAKRNNRDNRKFRIFLVLAGEASFFKISGPR
jgi:hypothetical protein